MKRGFVLKVVLEVLVFLSFGAVFVNLFSYDNEVRGDFVEEFLPVVLLIFFWILYVLAVRKFLFLSAFSLIGILSFSAFYLTYKWGTMIPQSWIILSLTIVLGGILINSVCSFFLAIVDGAVLLLMTFGQKNGILNYQVWNQSPMFGSILVAIFTFLTIALISWLSNNETENALRRLKKSENDLKKQRDNLEVMVEKRTKELRKKQLEKIVDLYKFADFGRLTAGLFHNIANPLTQVSLNLSNIKCKTTGISPELKKIDPIVKRAISGTEQMQRLLISVRKQIQQQETKSFYSLWREIKSVTENFEYKAKELNVSINLIGNRKIKTFGNSMRFYQLVSNLVSNALDSYYKVERKEHREVIVSLEQEDKMVMLGISDFGSGIDPRIAGRIFDPLFTTKDLGRGTGIGLYVARTIVEKEFGGKIEVKSKLNEGTTFVIRFPIRNKLNDG